MSSGRSPPTQRCSCPGRKQQQDISLHSDGTGKDELPLPATGETDRSRVNNLAGTEVAWQCSPPRAADGAWTQVFDGDEGYAESNGEGRGDALEGTGDALEDRADELGGDELEDELAGDEVTWKKTIEEARTLAGTDPEAA